MVLKDSHSPVVVAPSQACWNRAARVEEGKRAAWAVPSRERRRAEPWYMISGSGVEWLPRVMVPSCRCPLKRPTRLPDGMVQPHRTQTPGGSRSLRKVVVRALMEPSKRPGRLCRRAALSLVGGPRVTWTSVEKEKGWLREDDIRPLPAGGGGTSQTTTVRSAAVGGGRVVGRSG